MNNAKGFIFFMMGVTAGSIITWNYTKAKYERIAQEEIESVKEMLKKKQNNLSTEVDNIKPNLVDESYIRLVDEYNGSKDMAKETIDAPYVISPEEFGDLDDYDTTSLWYYADSVLADDNDEIVDDVEEIVGVDSLAQFNEHGEDSVYVRNDALRCDYEILRDFGKYSEIITKANPRRLGER